MNRILLILAVLLSHSCNGQDYSVQESTIQKIDLENIKYVIVECYCSNGVDVAETTRRTIQIDIKGRLESRGYHGRQETPNSIGLPTLSFKKEIQNDTLRLVSKEWTFMHHSYLIEDLKIQIPKGIKHKIVKIDGGELEGRRVK